MNTNTDKLFFEDCFTETQDGIDLEVNHLTVGCITSSEDNFNLDSDGNLTVKTITTTNQILGNGNQGKQGTFIGDISLWSGDPQTIPSTHMLCEGQILNINEYPTLYDKIGAIHGGNGITTFALPDLRGRVATHVKSNEVEFDTLGKTGGDRTHQLTVAQMPNHKHSSGTLCLKNVSPGGSTPYNWNTSWATGGQIATDDAIASQGGNQAHNNLQPYITLYYIIKVKGDFYTEDLTNLDAEIQELKDIVNGLTNNNLDIIYPVGSIYLSINDVNPSTLFGGTWVSFGSGEALTGVDTSKPEFNTVEKTGGSINQVFGLESGYARIHHAGGAIHGQEKTGVSSWNRNLSITVAGATATGAQTDGIALGGTTSSGSILQPYITCYMWKRTA